jgi:pyruvate dehydrogenase (quinone)
MTSLTAGDVLVNTLIDRGVDTGFGIPGDGINGLIESLRLYRDFGAGRNPSPERTL